MEPEEPARADVADQPPVVLADQVRVPHGDRREPVGRQRQLGGVEHVLAVEQVDRASTDASVTRSVDDPVRSARVVGCSKSPHVLVATSHRSPSRTTWVAWSPYTPGRSGRRKNRSPRVPQLQGVGGEAPQARVAAVEEARTGRGRAQPEVALVAQRRAVGVADEPEVAQPQLAEAARHRRPGGQLDAQRGQGRLVVQQGDVDVVAQVPTGSRDPRALLAGPGGEVGAGEGQPQLGRILGPSHPPAPVLARGAVDRDGHRHGGAVVRQAQSHPGQVQRERRRRRGGGEGRRRGDVRRERGQGVQAALVGGDAGPGHQVDRAQAAHDLEAGQHRAIVAAGAAPPREGRCRKADQPSVIRGSPPTRPVPAMVHLPLRTVPPFQACRTHDRVAICAQ